MKRPLSNLRPFGPFVVSSTESDIPPCNKIISQERELLEDMVEKTQNTGKEHIVVLVETDDEIYSTDVVQGEEESISEKVTVDLSMDATMLAINNTPGPKGDPSDYDKHQIHTHPNGYNEQSLTDIESIAQGLDIKHPSNRMTSHLILVENKDENRVELLGLYNYGELTETDVTNVKAVLNTTEAMGDRNRMTIGERKKRIIDELKAKGYNHCMGSFSR